MFIQEVRSEGHVAVGGRGVSLTAWVIQKGPRNTAGRLNCGPSPDPCVIPLTLSLKSVHLLAAPSLVCLALAWMPPGKGHSLGLDHSPPHNLFVVLRGLSQ